ncbi:MAG TPA: 50S ribosomal protein L17 [Tenericutes bacterium]|jgi:large subunit ribosomal protein L17|nr:50S ribosomal protein L17 [Mycoplasmatota bacterium]
MGRGYKKIGRASAERKALLRDLLTDLFVYEKIETTLARTKEVKRLADKLITLGKRGDLHARRQAESILRKKAVEDNTILQKLFNDIAPRYKERKGGYTRILKLTERKGDGTLMAIIELVK